MSIRSLICVSGTCMALGVAGAVAQQQPGTQPDKTPVPSQTTASADNVDNLLEKRQGVWQVEVMVNTDFWSKMHGGTTAVDERYITKPGEDPGARPKDLIRDPARDPDRDPAKNPDAPGTDRPGDFPWKTDQDKQNDPSRVQPGAHGQQGVTTTDQGMMRLTGYAESRLVLDNRILQERIVVPMGNATRFRADTDDKQPEPADQPRDNQARNNRQGNNQVALPDTIGEDSFNGISFIEFNESGHTYDMVFLCNMSEGIKYESGYFDAQRNRIVFRGRSNDGRMGDAPAWQRNEPDRAREPAGTDRTDPSRDNSRDLDRARTPIPAQPDAVHAGRPGMENFVVVLEIVDNDTQKVTMYDTGRASGAGEEWRNRPGNLDGRVDPGAPGNVKDRDEPGEVDDDDNPTTRDPLTRQPADPSRIGETQPGSAGSEFGAIVYQATYTRAPTSMEARIRSIIDESITVASR